MKFVFTASIGGSSINPQLGLYRQKQLLLTVWRHFRKSYRLGRAADTP